jgi:translocation and assembly module TamB
MRRARLVAAFLVLLLVGASWAATHRLLHTEAGLQWALAQLARIPSVRIEADGASGTLAGPLTVRRVVVEHDAVRVEAEGVRLDLRVRSLLAGSVYLEQASVDRVEVTLKHREPPPPRPPGFLPGFLEIAAPDLRVANAGLRFQDGRRIAVASVRAALDMSRWRIGLTNLAVDDPAGHVDGTLVLRATEPLGLRTALNGHWQLPDGRTYRFAAAARGRLDRLGATVTLSEPANLSFVGYALSLDEAPRIVGTLRPTDFDGSPWVPAGRFPKVTGSIALDARATAFGFDGALSAAAFGDGPVRLQGSGHWESPTLAIDSLRAWLPRSTLALSVSGSARLTDDAPALDLSGEWVALRWPLTGAAQFESPLGLFSLKGALPYSFDVQAEARLPAIEGTPEAKFAAAGSVDRDQVALDRFDGEVLRGRLTGSGRLSWAGEQPWSARLEAKNLDVAVVRPDLPGRVSAVATVDGRGFTPASPWTARLASLSGTLLGRALTGRGEVSHRDGNFDLRGVRIANGPSHVDLDGRWGSTVDLKWDANVRSLALLHPALRGELVSSGTARGSPAHPNLKGELRARQLGVGGITVATLDAEADLDGSDRRDSWVDLRAASVSIGAVTLDRATFDARGRLAEHGAALEISSQGAENKGLPAFRARLAAIGEYEGRTRTWRGQLQDVSAAFPDGTASLLQPADIVASPEAWRVAPVCLETGAARLCGEGEGHAKPGSWRVIYSAQDWPLRRLLRTLLGWKEFDGRLQAAGWISQEAGHDWIGGMTLVLDEPTLDIPRNQFRTERIDLGRGRLDVFAEPAEMRAKLDLDFAESTAVEGEVIATRTPGRDAVDYPLHGSIRGRSSALTALPVFVPEIDRSGGSLEGTVSIGGTLGEPRFDGEFHVRDGRFDIYRANLQLSAVSLDGRFEGDDLVFEGRGTTTRGAVFLDGRFTWPEDVMTGELHLKGDQLMLADTPDYRIVASPDLTIASGKDGYTVRGEVLIPTARITPKDLSTTVGTSPDERIAGTETEDAGPSTLERVRSRVRVTLGDDVRVDSHGLKAKLGGAVTVTTRPGDVVRGNGSIRVIEGEYKAFGQYVRIKRGVLSYHRTPIDEPTLDLVGEREIKQEDIVVSINVRGTLSSPFVTLSSEPPMPEAEALSYLLTGRSIDTLQSGEAASLDRAAQSLAVGSGGMLLGGLGTRLGLDEVSVEQTGEEDASVVLGKYLSPRLFVSYGISIVEAINTIKLRYTLNERWSLKAEAGLEQSGDIEFKIER